MNLTSFLILLTGVLLNAAAQLGLKAATRASGVIQMTGSSLWQSGLTLVREPALWGALLAYGLSLIIWIVGLSRVPVSQAYPLLSLGYVVNALFAWMLLGENVNLMRMGGIGIIMIGVLLVARS